jgi:hypothetical protein
MVNVTLKVREAVEAHLQMLEKVEYRKCNRGMKMSAVESVGDKIVYIGRQGEVGKPERVVKSRERGPESAGRGCQRRQEEGWGGLGERSQGGWGEGPGPDGRERGPREGQGGGPGKVGWVGRGLQSCLGRAKVWSIITSHPCLCMA